MTWVILLLAQTCVTLSSVASSWEDFWVVGWGELVIALNTQVNPSKKLEVCTVSQKPDLNTDC